MAEREGDGFRFEYEKLEDELFALSNHVKGAAYLGEEFPLDEVWTRLQEMIERGVLDEMLQREPMVESYRKMYDEEVVRVLEALSRD